MLEESIGNESMGVAVIIQTLPEFDITALYQPDRNVAITEFNRVAAIYGL